MRSRFFRKALFRAVTLILMASVLAVPNASASDDGQCLFLSGTVKQEDRTANMHSPITFEYTVSPGGNRVQLVRDPVDISLVLDVSGSMSYKMTTARNSVSRLATLKNASQSLLTDLQNQQAGDQVGLITFSNLGKQESGLTNLYLNLQKKIDDLTAGGGTNIEDGLAFANKLLSASPTGNGKQFVILVTDGYANMYRDGNKSRENRSEAKKRALGRAEEFTSRGTQVYTVALGSPGTSDIDHQLLKDISDKTGGIKYDASSTAELITVFQNIKKTIDKQGEISNIEIRQPLPRGFVLQEETDPQYARIEGGVLIVRLPNMVYPFAVNTSNTFPVKLKQTLQTGTYEFEDADLLYRNACSQDRSATIPNHNIVTITGWVDVWGNLYTSTEDGSVSRYRYGDLREKQFTIPGKGSSVRNITFDDSPGAGVDDDAIVNVEFNDGTRAQWDLRPSAPSIVLSEPGGTVITRPGWHKGLAQVQLSGGGPSPDLDFTGANPDFQSGYVHSYQNQVNAEGWTDTRAPAFTLNRLGSGITVEARAVTSRVSGDTGHLTYGDPVSRSVSLDHTPPEISLNIDYGNGTRDTDPSLEITAADGESPVTKIVLTVENRTQTILNPGAGALTFRLSDPGLLPAESDRKGWKKISVSAVNASGLENTFSTYNGKSQQTHDFLLNPGPSFELVTKDGNSYDTVASGKPVVLKLEQVLRDIAVKRGDAPDSYDVGLADIEYRIETVPKPGKGHPTDTSFLKLRSFELRLTGAGRNTVTVRLTDSTGKKLEKSIVVLIDYDQKRF